MNFHVRLLILCHLMLLSPSSAFATECDQWQQKHPEWIWCDSFETVDPLRSRYEDVSTNGLSRSTMDAFEGSAALQQAYNIGQVEAGWLIKVKPEGYPQHIFYRWYHKFGPGYTSLPPKMARAGFRDRNSWQDIFKVHTWIANNAPALDVLALQSSHGPWLPIAHTSFNLLKNLDQWVYFEVEIKLNTVGKSDGLYRMWVNDKLEVERTNVDLRGNTNLPINEVTLDTYWNGGAPTNLVRYYDNFVIATQRIGPLQNQLSPPLPPSALGATQLQ
jgi:hypothetical protein